MVLTDGSVMLQGVTSDVWWRLRPDASGSYLNGSYKPTPRRRTGTPRPTHAVLYCLTGGC